MKLQDFYKITSGLRLAHKISLKSTHVFKMGCSILRKGKPISVGHNWAFKCHPYVAKNGEYVRKSGDIHKSNSIHAEIAAILKVKNRELLKDCVLYVYREKKDGTLGNARPCPMCYGLIKDSGIKKIVYTSDDGIIEESV